MSLTPTLAYYFFFFFFIFNSFPQMVGFATRNRWLFARVPRCESVYTAREAKNRWHLAFFFFFYDVLYLVINFLFSFYIYIYIPFFAFSAPSFSSFIETLLLITLHFLYFDHRIARAISQTTVPPPLHSSFPLINRWYNNNRIPLMPNERPRTYF